MNSTSYPSSARRLFDIAEALCRAVGNAIRPGFIAVAMAILVCARIRRVRAALLALEARFLEGRVRQWGIRAEGARAGLPASRMRVDANSLPRRFGWLCGFVPGEAACFAGQMRVVLAEPEMVALLAGCPQAVRLLGPLCLMLGIERADWVPGAVREAPVAVRPVRVRRVFRVGLATRPDLDFTFVPRRFRLKIG
jgi:hypothetical protein